jgi:hypothetical protein
VPTVSRFFGIVIRMDFDDHAPSLFQAVYGSDEAIVGIETMDVLEGPLPRRNTITVPPAARIWQSLPTRGD